ELDQVVEPRRGIDPFDVDGREGPVAFPVRLPSTLDADGVVRFGLGHRGPPRRSCGSDGSNRRMAASARRGALAATEGRGGCGPFSRPLDDRRNAGPIRGIGPHAPERDQQGKVVQYLYYPTDHEGPGQPPGRDGP